jgi:hypothetical protein
VITIAEVIEQCERVADDAAKGEVRDIYDSGWNAATLHIAARIRALAAQYEGCIVAEGETVPVAFNSDSMTKPLYRARETQR